MTTHRTTPDPCYCNDCIGVPRRVTAQETCEVCGRSAAPAKHPCRFAKACRCWYGIPCDGSGRVLRHKAYPDAMHARVPSA